MNLYLVKDGFGAGDLYVGAESFGAAVERWKGYVVEAELYKTYEVGEPASVTFVASDGEIVWPDFRPPAPSKAAE